MGEGDDCLFLKIDAFGADWLLVIIKKDDDNENYKEDDDDQDLESTCIVRSNAQCSGKGGERAAPGKREHVRSE